ncbi:hypothetical protein PH5382_01095 [Phaeobacter sp. CECT 5382]|uniref:cation-transporting P-type ATPase n=1 Tax=Phaeobacter sp. CECT 5382 TaxID=1712645 RepID=UPI0006DA4486|nr:cation-transporting P-type ATPase [Phaeobacter sp. CECT 5382]CUH87170.1 hypothetical protein PH5382_01095 [Phaeobacter sp. CECT 5382]
MSDKTPSSASADQTQTDAAWEISADEMATRLDTNLETGLDGTSAAQKLAQVGRNKLVEAEQV